jgi:hypothetical protein
VKQECLSKLILFGEAAPRRALTEYAEHDHQERNHQGKGNHFPLLARGSLASERSSAAENAWADC